MGLSLGALDILHEKKLCISHQPNVIVPVRIQEWEAVNQGWCWVVRYIWSSAKRVSSAPVKSVGCWKGDAASVFSPAAPTLGMVGPCLPWPPQKDVGRIEEGSQQKYRKCFLVFNHLYSSLFRELKMRITSWSGGRVLWPEKWSTSMGSANLVAMQ